jgi:citrate lyase subunit beta/citryl-CoA lyase
MSLATSGHAGAKAKSDCLVTFDPREDPSATDKAPGQAAAPAALRIEVRSGTGSLFSKSIAAIVSKVATHFGVNRGRFLVEDDGALDLVVAARTEAALRQAGFPVPPAPRLANPVRLPATDPARRRRSRLYIPGDQPHLAINAALFGADCLIFDLEDAVVPGRKAETRILVRKILETPALLGTAEPSKRFDFPEIAVRINPLSGPWGMDDLAEIMPAGPQVIVLPKCESARDIEEADRALQIFETALGIAPGSTRLMPIVETARGILASREIAAASSRNVAIFFGREDLVRDLQAQPAPTASTSFDTLAWGRAMLVFAARAAGIQPLDSVYTNLEDPAGLRVACQDARAAGFAGKAVLHPVQIPVVNESFLPTEEDAARARRILAGFEAALAEGKGAVSVDGMMVDAPVAERARKVLQDFEGVLK